MSQNNNFAYFVLDEKSYLARYPSVTSQCRLTLTRSEDSRAQCGLQTTTGLLSLTLVQVRSKQLT